MFRRIAPLLAITLIAAACGVSGPNRDRLLGNGIPDPAAITTMRGFMEAVGAGTSTDEIWARLPEKIRDSRAKDRWVATSTKPISATEKAAIAKLVVSKGGKMLPAVSGKWLAFTGKSAVAYAVLQRASIAKVVPDFKISLDPVEKANAEARVSVDGELARPSLWNPIQKPNDVYYDELWGLRAIDAAGAWKKATGKNVIVAVLDTGIDASHPDLRGAAYVNGYDFTEGLPLYAAYRDDWPESRYIPHGTHVAGTIAAVANNGYGIIGVAPNVKLMPVRVLNEEGGGYLSDVAAGIEWAANKGAKVANMSLRGGGYGYDTYQEIAAIFGPSIGVAMSKGMAIVAASGNDYVNELYEDVTIWPADDPRVIRVAARSDEGWVSEFSNSAPNMTVTAPGENILSTYSPRGYTRWAGTSMATPHVAGVVALMKSVNGALTPAQLRAYLRAGATDIDYPWGEYTRPGFDEQSGAGMLSASASVNAAAAKRGVIDLAVGDPLAPRITPAGGFSMTISTNATNAKCTLRAALYQTPLDAVPYPQTVWGFPGNEEFPRELLSEADLTGTTCGSRSVTLAALDAAFAAAGEDPIPTATSNLSVVFTARTGTLSTESYAIPLFPPDTVDPEIASVHLEGGPYTIDYARTVHLTDAYTYDPYGWEFDVAVNTTWSDGSTTEVESLNELMAGACDEPANVYVFDICTLLEVFGFTDDLTASALLGYANLEVVEGVDAAIGVSIGRTDLNDFPKWAQIFATADATSSADAEFLKNLFAGADPVSVQLMLTAYDTAGNSVAEDPADVAPVALMTLVRYAEGNPEDAVWYAGADCSVSFEENTCDEDLSRYYYEDDEDGTLLYPYDGFGYIDYEDNDNIFEVLTSLVGNAIPVSTFTYTGSGNEVAISAVRGDDFDGTISITIDGVVMELIDLTGDGSGVDELVFKTYAVDPGEHTLVVTSSGTVNLNAVRIGDSPIVLP